MGLLLREALRRFCAEIGWSYAVFWNAIHCGNSRHLVWAEGHHEPIRLSRQSLRECGMFRATGGDPDPLAELTCQEEDRVGNLVNRMRSQVHVVGDGVVGRTAVTGNHQWMIIQDGEGYISERSFQGLGEMSHQFFAGIRTIAVIPVLPHGVVQLGSIQMIMENMSLIERVQQQLLQLGCVPGAFSSDATSKDLDLKNEVSILGLRTSLNHSGNACSNLSDLLSFNNENFVTPINKIPMTSPPTQSSCIPGKPLFVGEPLDFKPATTIVGTSVCSQSDQAVVPPILCHNGLQDGQSVVSNADVQLQQTKMRELNIRSQSQHLVVGSSLPYSNLSYLEGHVFPNAGQQRFLNSLPTSDSIESIQLRPRGKTISSSLKDSLLLLGREVLSNSGNHFGISGLLPCGTERETIGIQCVNSYPSSAVHVLSTNHSSGNCASAEVTRSTGDKYPESMSTVTLSNIGGDFFEAVETPCSKTSTLCSGSSNYGVQDCWVDNSNCTRSTQGVKNIICAGRSSCAAANGQEGTGDYKSLIVSGSCATDECIPRLSGDDLYDVLGIDFKSKHCSGGLDTFAANGNGLTTGESGADLSTCIGQLEVDPVFDATHDGISSCSGIFSESGPDQLLDAVVSKINPGTKQISDDDLYCKTTMAETSNSLIHVGSSECGWASLQQQMHGEHFGLPPALKTEAASSSVLSAGSVDKTGECSQKDAVYKSQISLWVENGQNMKIDGMLSAPCKRIDEVCKLNRKRPRPGESPRPRPKDRQMIQDRVKELREIVPNGAKCSIDALLERTIKHMLFLQSVTKHADKLKETGESKIISKEGGLLLKDNFEGGATWAFEVGTRSTVCPIIVEDLNPPRQLLVEMLCEERGFFLEIADFIRGLGLTILKGVMEARKDKVWARFAVEANRDVSRKDIFMSLVCLLQPTTGGGVAAQGFNSSNIPCNMVCQPSIPATGLANHLQ